MRSEKFSGKYFLFFCTIALGIILPFAVLIIVQLIFNPNDIFKTLKFSSLFDNINIFIILAQIAWNDIPFIILAFLILSLWDKPIKQSSQAFFLHKTGVIGAIIATIGIVLFFNISIWVDVTLGLPGSSTSVIAYFYLPFYAFISMMAGYLLGRFGSKLILRIGKRMKRK